MHVFEHSASAGARGIGFGNPDLPTFELVSVESSVLLGKLNRDRESLPKFQISILPSVFWWFFLKKKWRRDPAWAPLGGVDFMLGIAKIREGAAKISNFNLGYRFLYVFFEEKGKTSSSMGTPRGGWFYVRNSKNKGGCCQNFKFQSCLTFSGCFF